MFAVAAHSLLKFYDGPIHIVLGQNTPEFFIEVLSSEKRIGYSFAKRRYFDDTLSGNRRREWLEKPFIISRESPFTNTLYYDCDHCFIRELDLTIFEQIAEKKLTTCAPDSPPRRQGKVIRQIRAVTGVEYDSVHRVNGGCIGYQKGYEGMEDIIDLMRLYRGSGQHLLRNNAEEFALATVVEQGIGHRLPTKWSAICDKKYTDATPPPDTIAVHYVNRRYRWRMSWREAMESSE